MKSAKVEMKHSRGFKLFNALQSDSNSTFIFCTLLLKRRYNQGNLRHATVCGCVMARLSGDVIFYTLFCVLPTFTCTNNYFITCGRAKQFKCRLLPPRVSERNFLNFTGIQFTDIQHHSNTWCDYPGDVRSKQVRPEKHVAEMCRDT